MAEYNNEYVWKVKDRPDVIPIFEHLGDRWHDDISNCRAGCSLKLMHLDLENLKYNPLIHLEQILVLLPVISRALDNSFFRAFAIIIFIYYLFPLNHKLCEGRVCFYLWKYSKCTGVFLLRTGSFVKRESQIVQKNPEWGRSRYISICVHREVEAKGIGEKGQIEIRSGTRS